MEKVEIVCRCKKCFHYEPQYNDSEQFKFGYCYYWDYEQGMSPNTVDEDDFCSHAELNK